MAYAGFWKRFAAVWIDSLITSVISTILGILYVFLYILPKALSADAENVAEMNAEFQGYWIVINLAIAWIYYSVFESSSKQGTLGKLAVGIKVTDMHGNRIKVGIAFGRNFTKLFSMMIFFIGFIMVAFAKRKQGLHDITAGCLVVRKDAAAPDSNESREDSTAD
ncbi:MAG: RDD family protein [Candidatus Latescibacteria bacterium]|nr:RDD family protein [Candidatus Latescibacterota bacterium]